MPEIRRKQRDQVALVSAGEFPVRAPVGLEDLNTIGDRANEMAVGGHVIHKAAVVSEPPFDSTGRRADADRVAVPSLPDGTPALSSIRGRGGADGAERIPSN